MNKNSHSLLSIAGEFFCAYKEVTEMLFTEGKRRKYERLMKERPGFDRREPEDESERSNTAKGERRKRRREKRKSNEKEES